MSAYAEDYFYFNRWILCTLGLWPPRDKTERIQFLYKIYAILVFLFINVYYAAMEAVSFFYIYANKDDLINHLSIVLSHLVGIVKTIFFLLRRDKLMEVINILESEELRYEECEEKNFFPGKISKACKATAVKYTLLWTSSPLVMLTFSYSPLVVSTILYMKHGDGTRKLPEHLPYYSWIPFETKTAGSYLTAIAFQAFPLLCAGYSSVGLDALYVSILHCVAENLVIMQGAFLTIKERSLKNVKEVACANELYNSERLNAAMNLEMRKICKNLQTILKICTDLEQAYKYVTLSQSLCTLFTFCSSLYLTSTTPPSSKQFIPQIIYLVVMSLQPFIYCWFGNGITLKASEISNYVYQSDWVAADIKFKRSIIIAMARLNKPVYLTAGGFAPLTMATFFSLMKASYSFYTFLANAKK